MKLVCWVINQWSFERLPKNMSFTNNVVDSAAVPQLDYLSQFGSAEKAFDMRYKHASYQLVYPENTSSSNYRFSFSTQFGSVVQDLKSCILVTTVSLTKKDGTKLPDNAKVAPCSNLHANLWRTVKCYINNCNVLNLENYGVYCNIKALTEATELDKRTHLKKQFYIEDTVGQYENFETNQGFLERREIFGTSSEETAEDGSKVPHFTFNDEEHQMVGKLELPLPNITYLPYPCEIKLDLERAPDSYVLMGDSDTMDVKLNVHKVQLYVLNLTLNDSLYLKIQEKLNSSSLRYFYDDVNIACYSLGKGENECHIETLGVGRLPSEVYIAVVESDRHFGKLTKNCMRFPLILKDQNNSANGATLSSVKLSIGGADVDGLSVEPSDGEYSLNYYKFYMLQNMLCGDKHLAADIDPQRYKRDVHFHYFNLKTGLNTAPEYLSSPIKSGFMRCTVKFASNTVDPVTIYALTLSSAAIVLEKGGRVLKETT